MCCQCGSNSFKLTSTLLAFKFDTAVRYRGSGKAVGKIYWHEGANHLFIVGQKSLTLYLNMCLKGEPKQVCEMLMEAGNALTCGTEETPFLDSATHKYCLIALMNISLVWNTGPAFWRMESSSCRDRILERISCDLCIRHGEVLVSLVGNAEWGTYVWQYGQWW